MRISLEVNRFIDGRQTLAPRFVARLKQSEDQIAFNNGNPYRGSTGVEEGNNESGLLSFLLLGISTSCDFWTTLSTNQRYRCGTRYPNVAPKAKRDFTLVFELYCLKRKWRDFVKVSNTGPQGDAKVGLMKCIPRLVAPADSAQARISTAYTDDRIRVGDCETVGHNLPSRDTDCRSCDLIYLGNRAYCASVRIRLHLTELAVDSGKLPRSADAKGQEESRKVANVCQSSGHSELFT